MREQGARRRKTDYGTCLAFLLFGSPETAILGLGEGRQTGAAAGSRGPRPRPKLGLGCARAEGRLSRLRDRSAGSWKQRGGARIAVQHRRTRAGSIGAG